MLHKDLPKYSLVHDISSWWITLLDAICGMTDQRCPVLVCSFTLYTLKFIQLPWVLLLTLWPVEGETSESLLVYIVLKLMLMHVDVDGVGGWWELMFWWFSHSFVDNLEPLCAKSLLQKSTDISAYFLYLLKALNSPFIIFYTVCVACLKFKNGCKLTN